MLAAAGETSETSFQASSFSSSVIITIIISMIRMIKMINTGIGIMILIIPYAFASVIKQLQMEEEIAR